MSISKHAAQPGDVYRLLRQSVPQRNLQIQQELLASAKDREALLQTIRQHLPEMESPNASTALHLLAQGSWTAAPPVCSELVTQLLADQALQPRDVSLAAWSMARMEVRQPQSLEALAAALLPLARELNGQDASQVAWAYATLQTSDSPAVIQAVATASWPRLSEFSPRHQVGLLWALASSRVRHEDYCWAAAGQAEANARHWVPQDFANFLWAFAVLRPDAPVPLTMVVDAAACFGWKHFSPQELTISMWAAAALGRHDARPVSRAAVQRLLQHGARELRSLPRAEELEPIHCTNAAWALARWQRHCRLTGWPQACKPATCRPALRTLSKTAAGRLGSFGAKELSRLIWALGSQGCLHLSLLAAPLLASLRAEGLMASWDAEELVSVLSALTWAYERRALEPPSARMRSLRVSCQDSMS